MIIHIDVLAVWLHSSPSLTVMPVIFFLPIATRYAFNDFGKF